MIVAKGVEMFKHNGVRKFDIEPKHDDDAINRIPASEFVEWIRKYAPELLEEE